MVATTRSDESKGSCVSRVLGKNIVSPEGISPGEWVAILRAVVKELPVEYLRGFRPIEQILVERNGYKVERRLPKRFPPLILRASKAEPEHVTTSLRPSAVFLACATTGDVFPSGEYRADRYKNAPRGSSVDGIWSGELLRLTSGHVLLSRDKVLYGLTLVWKPFVDWEGDFSRETPHEFWYEADPTSLIIQALDDDELARLLDQDSMRRLPVEMLQVFERVLRETSISLLNQYNNTKTCQSLVLGCLERTGHTVF